MPLPKLIEATAPSSTGTKRAPFFFAYATARSVAGDPIFQVWKGPKATASNKVLELTQEGRVFISAPAGSTPAYSFIDDETTGLSRDSAGVLGLYVDGTRLGKFSHASGDSVVVGASGTTSSLYATGGNGMDDETGAFLHVTGVSESLYDGACRIRSAQGGIVSIGGTGDIVINAGLDEVPLCASFLNRLRFFHNPADIFSTLWPKQTVTGSAGANAALDSLLTALAAYGLITDSST